MKHLLVVLLLVVLAETRQPQTDCYNSTRLRDIPSEHLYNKLMVDGGRPLVIGHMGNVQTHQENTLEGMKSLVRIKAGGMHMHVRLTKDNKLILFKDDNLRRLTGLNYEVRRLPYSEIVKMPLLKTIEYKVSGSRTEKLSYSTRPTIPLLKDVLQSVKGSNLLIYIELLPSNVPPSGPLDRYRGFMTSKLTSQLIDQLNMQNQVIVVSRDAFKLKALDHFAPHIVSGWWMDKTLFTPAKGNSLRKVYHEIPDIYYSECFTRSPNGTKFTEYLLRSGIVHKAVNASLVDLQIDMYDQQKTLKGIIGKNYGLGTTLGAFGITTWNLTDKAKAGVADIGFIQTAVDNGVTRFITDDVNRVKRALHEATTGAGSRLRSNYYGVVVVTILVGKALVTLLFV